MKPAPGTVWEAGGFRLNIARGKVDGSAIYCLAQFMSGPYRNPSWDRVDYSARDLLSEIVRDYGDVPGLADLVGVLPDNPALASKSFWRSIAEYHEAMASVAASSAKSAAQYRALEQAAIFERGCLE